MKIVYMGTPDFAVPALETICAQGWDVPLVITKPDRPASRGHKMQQCDVKKKALELGLPVESPERVKNDPELVAQLKAIAPDFIVVAAYGKILPKEILEIPAHGCINIHGSLLPKYRGAAPIQRAVLNGDPESGVTIMYMAEECDAGDILAQRAVSIVGKTSEQVFEELSVLGAELLAESLPKIISGELQAVPQDASQATYTAMIRKDEGLIDWTRDAKALESHVLGMYSWPIAYT
ncbi:MAG: methionyl-tRNA formyltransferase, partial [Firmicutes bacterium]|nr:methionyl-tRNA formyltransferase [Bacillota bacterium]